MKPFISLLSPLILLVAGAAVAGPPSPCNSSVPCGIVLVGTNGAGAPDPVGTFTVITRHLSNNPWSEGPVVFDFGGCPDVSICSAQVTQGVLVTCEPGTRTVSAIPDPSGVVTLTLVGGVIHRSTPATTGCLQIFAGGVLLTDGICHQAVSVGALDESGGDGLGPEDLSLWLADFFSNGYLPRSDFDHPVLCVDNLSPSDFSRWMGSFFGGYVRGCGALAGTLCP